MPPYPAQASLVFYINRLKFMSMIFFFEMNVSSVTLSAVVTKKTDLYVFQDLTVLSISTRHQGKCSRTNDGENQERHRLEACQQKAGVQTQSTCIVRTKVFLLHDSVWFFWLCLQDDDSSWTVSRPACLVLFIVNRRLLPLRQSWNCSCRTRGAKTGNQPSWSWRECW